MAQLNWFASCQMLLLFLDTCLDTCRNECELISLATRKHFKVITMRISAPSTEGCPVTSSCIQNQGTIFLTCAEEAGLLYLAEIPVQGRVRIRVGFHVETGRLILTQAKQSP